MRGGRALTFISFHLVGVFQGKNNVNALADQSPVTLHTTPASLKKHAHTHAIRDVLTESQCDFFALCVRRGPCAPPPTASRFVQIRSSSKSCSGSLRLAAAMRSPPPPCIDQLLRTPLSRYLPELAVLTVPRKSRDRPESERNEKSGRAKADSSRWWKGWERKGECCRGNKI